MQINSKIFIVAGEASGDANGALLVNDLYNLNKEISYHGIGGNKLKESNVNLIYDYSTVNYIGFTNVILNIRKIKKVLANTVEYVKKLNPDVIILIDFPGFNLKFAELVRNFYKGKIIYYISPQIWAWHKSRIEKIKAYIDKMLVIFPFEVDFYKELGFKADYVGHPLYNKIEYFLNNNKKISSDKINISLLPGSRIEEIQRILPSLATTSDLLKKEFNAEINLIYPEYIEPAIYNKILKGRNFNLIPNKEDSHLKILYNSDLVLTKFGTTTLELALLKVPFVSVYKAGIFNYYIAKFLSNIDFVSMPNILAGKQIVKELIQSEMNTKNIFEESKEILTNKQHKECILKEFDEVKAIFKNTPINKTAAEIINQELTSTN